MAELFKNKNQDLAAFDLFVLRSALLILNRLFLLQLLRPARGAADAVFQLSARRRSKGLCPPPLPRGDRSSPRANEMSEPGLLRSDDAPLRRSSEVSAATPLRSGPPVSMTDFCSDDFSAYLCWSLNAENELLVRRGN
ncbi:hypothetical protein OROGR_009187 [Orobanche gracilis]